MERPNRAVRYLLACSVRPGPGWLHEIKYDGFRMMVRREAGRIQVLTRNGYDWTARFPLIVAAAEAIKAKGFLIDDEAVVCDESGMAMFDHRCSITFDTAVTMQTSFYMPSIFCH